MWCNFFFDSAPLSQVFLKFSKIPVLSACFHDDSKKVNLSGALDWQIFLGPYPNNASMAPSAVCPIGMILSLFPFPIQRTKPIDRMDITHIH